MNPPRFHSVQLDELPKIPCCCGTTQRGFADLPEAPASIHLLEVKDEPTCHFHQETAEIYLILSGEGHLELDGELVPVKPLSAVLIQPGCRHRALGPLTLVNIPVPRHNPDDFFYDQEAVSAGEVPLH